jgi:hypothetical protein
MSGCKGAAKNGFGDSDMTVHPLDRMATAVAFLFGALTAAPIEAQTIKDVAGFYALVSIDNVRPDGSIVPQYGANPKGALSLDPSGRYISMVRRSDLEKFASTNIREATALENKMAVRGGLAHVGTYTIDEAEKTITLRVEASTFPNQDRTEIKRPFTLTQNELTYSMSTPSVGTGTARLVWRRIR